MDASTPATSPSRSRTAKRNNAFISVTGLHRSGTSPLHRCLRQHPQISGFQDTGVSEDEGQHLQCVLPPGGAVGGPGRLGYNPAAHMTETHPLADAQTAAELFRQWNPHWDLSPQSTLDAAYRFLGLATHPLGEEIRTWGGVRS
jgi:hypothetical protein